MAESSEDGQKDDSGDGEEAGAGHQRGTVVFRLRFGCGSGPRIIAFIIIGLKPLSFLCPVHVGSGMQFFILEIALARFGTWVRSASEVSVLYVL